MLSCSAFLLPCLEALNPTFKLCSLSSEFAKAGPLIEEVIFMESRQETKMRSIKIISAFFAGGFFLIAAYMACDSLKLNDLIVFWQFPT